MADTSDVENTPPQSAPTADTERGTDYIADSLKALYKAAEQEPLPERFAELLQRLATEDDP